MTHLKVNLVSIRQTVIAGLVGASVLLTPFVAQAKDNVPTEKKEVAQMCMVLSYIAHEALNERQSNKSEKVAKQNLYKKFASDSDKETQQFFKGLVDMSVADAYKIPVMKKAEEKEQALKEYAIGAFAGCVEELGFKVEDFSEADFD